VSTYLAANTEKYLVITKKIKYKFLLIRLVIILYTLGENGFVGNIAAKIQRKINAGL